MSPFVCAPVLLALFASEHSECRVPRLVLLLGVAIGLAGGMLSTARAQTPEPPPQPLLGSTIDAATLADLPIGNGPLSVLADAQPEAIGTRFLPGLSGVTPPLFGGFLNSPTQTRYRVGDLDITDPRQGGLPLLSPLLPIWDRVNVETGAIGVDDGAPALSMTLEPLRPGRTWQRTAAGFLSGGELVSDQSHRVPLIDLMRQWQDGRVLVSGPLTDRLGLVAAAGMRHLAHVAAPVNSASTDALATGFARVVFAATPRDEISAIGLIQHAGTTAYHDTGAHVQLAWERHDPRRGAFRLFGGYTERDRTTPLPSDVVDTLVDAPISDLIDTGAGTTRMWTIGARFTPAARRMWPVVGIDVDGAEMRNPPMAGERIFELVGGLPSRVWSYRAGSGPDVRQRASVILFADKRLTYHRLTVDAGVRVDHTTGRASQAAGGISWTNWLPRLMARVQVARTGDLAAIAAYRRSANQLPLDWLAVGDPAAPSADVSVWNGQSAGPLVARVGPGTGGDPALAQIDPRLKRPVTQELVLALQARPAKNIQLEVARVTKDEGPLVGLADRALAPADFTPVEAPDPNFIAGSPAGAPTVTAYSRDPASFGRDRYVLTNQAGPMARSWALELLARVTARRLTLFAGAALTWARGPAAAVGFLPSENDQDVLGSALVDPNAAIHAQGQLFQDRSHVAKIAGVYRFGWHIRLGAIARYADGQPFARLIIVPDLAQGPTAVRAYANGGSAFSYSANLDLRLQKTFLMERHSVTTIVDVYNLRGSDAEAAEYVAAGPAFRTPVTLHAPRTVLIGMRIDF